MASLLPELSHASPTCGRNHTGQLLTDVLDWAERNTVSTVLSCLAAHAGVLHSDGIQRHLLSDKQFGVFESTTVSDHELTRHAHTTSTVSAFSME